MIHISAAYKLLNEYELNNVEFDISYRSKSDGRLVSGKVICTSTNYSRHTANIKFVDSGQIRTIRMALIISINHTPIYL